MWTERVRTRPLRHIEAVAVITPAVRGPFETGHEAAVRLHQMAGGQGRVAWSLARALPPTGREAAIDPDLEQGVRRVRRVPRFDPRRPHRRRMGPPPDVDVSPRLPGMATT